MYVLSVRQGSDLAGSSYAIAKAFTSHHTITVRSAVRSTNYLDYRHDLAWSQLADEWPHADVVHLHENAKPRRILGDKPFVMHLHGTVFRRNVDLFRRYIADNGGVGVAATLDLLDLEPSLTWLPHPISRDMLPARRVTGGRLLRVAHAPTNRAIKATDAFLAACRLVGVEPVLIEGKTNAECLAIKATCDALYDQTELGYGVNAIEAWALGLPVIAGGAPSTLNRMRDEFGSLPFIETTADTIADALAVLQDDQARSEWADAGHAHYRRFHDGSETVRRLAPIYESLADRSRP